VHFVKKGRHWKSLEDFGNGKKLSDRARSISAMHLYDLLGRKLQCSAAVSEIECLAVPVRERRQQSGMTYE